MTKKVLVVVGWYQEVSTQDQVVARGWEKYVGIFDSVSSEWIRESTCQPFQMHDLFFAL